MEDGDKQQLLKEIRGSEGRQNTANPLAGLMDRWLECQDAQTASQALARAGALGPGTRRSGVARPRYLAPVSGLIGIPKLQASHRGEKIGFGSSALTRLAQSLVELGLANHAEWASANKTPSTLVDCVLRRFLGGHGQAIIAKHFELCLTLGESIVDSVYGEPDQAAAGQLFFVLNTESSFALGIGHTIDQLELVQAGLGEAFYDSLRQSLYRWIRVYDYWDARERIEQMAEWAEGENDPDSCEIPKLGPDLPACLSDRKFADRGKPLESFSLPDSPRLKKVVQLTLVLERVSHSVERPKIDGQSSPRLFFNAMCSAINSAKTSSLVCTFFSKNSIRFCFSSAWRRGRSVVWKAAAPFSKNSFCQR